MYLSSCTYLKSWFWNPNLVLKEKRFAYAEHGTLKYRTYKGFEQILTRPNVVFKERRNLFRENLTHGLRQEEVQAVQHEICCNVLDEKDILPFFLRSLNILC